MPQAANRDTTRERSGAPPLAERADHTNSPVGHAASVHLDLAVPNFAIQEARLFTPAEQDVFPGCPELKDGYYWANDKPGLGIDLNEELAAKFPVTDDPPFDYRWGNLRRKDGSVTKP